MASFVSNIGNEPARAPRFGGVIARRAKFTVPTGAVAGDDVTFCQLPKGVVILGGQILHDAATTTELNVGYGGGTLNGVLEDLDAFIDGADISAAGIVNFTQPAGLIDLDALDATRPLVGTFVTGDPTAGADIVCIVQYLLSA